MLILITNGTYGHSPILPDGSKSRYVVPVTRKSGPIDVDPDEASRLVELGVAEYVTDEPSVKAPKASEAIMATEDAGKTVTGHLDGVDLERMTFTELKALAQDMGIETGKIKSKASMIEAIASVEVEVPADDDLPDFEAQDVVD